MRPIALDPTVDDGTWGGMNVTGEGPRPVQRIDPRSDGVRLRIRLAEGYKVLPDGHHSVSVTSSDEAVVAVPPFEPPDLSFDWRVPVEVRGRGEALLRVQATVFFCPVSDESICLFSMAGVDQPVVVADGGQVEIVVDVEPM
jgi:hypothetical protein